MVLMIVMGKAHVMCLHTLSDIYSIWYCYLVFRYNQGLGPIIRPKVLSTNPHCSNCFPIEVTAPLSPMQQMNIRALD